MQDNGLISGLCRAARVRTPLWVRVFGLSVNVAVKASGFVSIAVARFEKVASTAAASVCPWNSNCRARSQMS